MRRGINCTYGLECCSPQSQGAGVVVSHIPALLQAATAAGILQSPLICLSALLQVLNRCQMPLAACMHLRMRLCIWYA